MRKDARTHFRFGDASCAKLTPEYSPDISMDMQRVQHTTEPHPPVFIAAHPRAEAVLHHDANLLCQCWYAHLN